MSPMNVPQALRFEWIFCRNLELSMNMTKQTRTSHTHHTSFSQKPWESNVTYRQFTETMNITWVQNTDLKDHILNDPTEVTYNNTTTSQRFWRLHGITLCSDRYLGHNTDTLRITWHAWAAYGNLEHDMNLLRSPYGTHIYHEAPIRTFNFTLTYHMEYTTRLQKPFTLHEPKIEISRNTCHTWSIHRYPEHYIRIIGHTWVLIRHIERDTYVLQSPYLSHGKHVLPHGVSTWHMAITEIIRIPWHRKRSPQKVWTSHKPSWRIRNAWHTPLSYRKLEHVMDRLRIFQV